MIDKEQISVMVRDIERYLSDLQEIDIGSRKDLEEKEEISRQYMLSRQLYWTLRTE